MTNPFESDGVWLRCALHAHTTRSDGELAPESLVDHYARAGWNALAVTDHWTITEPPARDDMVLLRGIELTCRTAAGGWLDVLVYGLDSELPVDAEDESTYPGLAEAMEFVANHGGVAYAAHPYWSSAPMDEIAALPAIVGIEVWNAGCELENGRGLSAVHWDQLLDSGRTCYAVACDDTHYAGFDSGYAWTMARAAAATPEALLEALRTGAAYGSTGPAFETIEPAAGGLLVRCSPCRSVTLQTGPEDGGRANVDRLHYLHRARVVDRDASGLITGVVFEPPPGAAAARVELADGGGGRAWSNPIAL
jgi:predicted metal-dependent phosphoesterase TrpH